MCSVARRCGLAAVVPYVCLYRINCTMLQVRARMYLCLFQTCIADVSALYCMIRMLYLYPRHVLIDRCEICSRCCCVIYALICDFAIDTVLWQEMLAPWARPKLHALCSLHNICKVDMMGVSQADKVIKLLCSSRSQECDFLGLTPVCSKLVAGHQACVWSECQPHPQ